MKENVVITIGRQLGGGGGCLAKELSRRLGLPVYNKELICEAAKQSGLRQSLFEQADERDSNVMPLGGSGLSVDSFSGSFCSGYINNDTLFGIQSQAIEALADKGGCILVGRCADYVLRDRSNVLSVFVTADLDERIERIARERNLSLREAENLIAQSEKRRSAYYNHYTFKTWGAAESYDLCLNATKLGIDGCADMVEAAIAKME